MLVRTESRQGTDMNAEQVARQLGISAKTVHRHIARGTIQAIQKSKQELSIAEDQVEILRQVLALDKPQYSSDLSQDMSRQIAALAERVTYLEERVRLLESDHMPLNVTEKPQKRKYKPRKADLPEGCILASKFAEQHGVPRPTFTHHMLIGLGPGTVPGELGDPMLPVKEQVDYSERDHPSRKGERERYLTPAQQKAALDFWKRHGVAFTVPETEQGAKQEAAWYLPD
jgi:DNA-binding transcriptional MerR regulator